MARTRLRLPASAAAGLIALAGGIWYFGKAPQFRRDPLVEAAGLLRVAATYEASYEACADPRYEREGVSGLAHALIGRAAHAFPAMSDAEAVRFARAALPDCRLDYLARRPRFSLTRARRARRFPVDIGAGDGAAD